MMYIIGCGAQAKYVLDIISVDRHLQILDPIGKKVDKLINGYIIEKLSYDKIDEKSLVYLCVANNKMKKALFDKLKNKKVNFNSAIHKQSIVSKTSEINSGCILNALSVIQQDVFVDKFTMVHANVLIEHDCIISSYCNIGPSATLCGHVHVGKYTTIGPASIICKTVKIGENCLIGAGSVVLNDIPDNTVAWGNPCKIKSQSEG